MKNGLSEASQCQLLDRLLEIIDGCWPNNVHVLMEQMIQPLEHLMVPRAALERKPMVITDFVQEFVAQNDIELYKSQLSAVRQSVTEANQKLIEHFAQKNSQSPESMTRQHFDPSSEGTDILMLLVYLGCKLSSQELSQASEKVVQICLVLSEGYRFKR